MTKLNTQAQIKLNIRNCTNYTKADEARHLQSLEGPIRRCPDCFSDKWTIIEGTAVCRTCGEEVK